MISTKVGLFVAASDETCIGLALHVPVVALKCSLGALVKTADPTNIYGINKAGCKE